ncbi:hypothetical protein [Flavobacterium sangjuense]|uniref:Uncharacterized protein n=1 Tax=Flavobacterium sangjuense TaxID=2518177 RepID=A0A4P7PVN0_9FLAO|nr:hypothetical protein [Flavobacterium sangjuense]QBZ98342.1 hypothetical protein GS03_01847 [Flavobacterium sangjuense]
MSKKVKAFLYNLVCFAILFISFRFLVDKYTNLTGLYIPITAFVIGTLTAPKFQAVKTPDGEKIFMRWLFLKGIREVG